MACATPALSAAKCEPAPEPLGEVEQLRLALEECGGSVAELSLQSGDAVEDVRALLAAEGLIGPKLRRESLTAEQLHSAGREYEAGASLRELAYRCDRRVDGDRDGKANRRHAPLTDHPHLHHSI